MLANIKKRHADDLQLVEIVYQYHKDIAKFTSRVESFDAAALRAYIVLLTHFSGELLELPSDLKIFTPEKLFDSIIDSKKLVQNDKTLCAHIVNLVEILVQINEMPDNDAFYKACAAYLDVALDNRESNVISVLFQIFHRLDQSIFTGIPADLLLKIVETAHNTQRSSEKVESFFPEALLLLDSSLRKKHNHKLTNTAYVLEYIWNDLCPSNIMKHQCDNCYTIIAQLIDSYLIECKENEKFRRNFLTEELWSFIRVAIESKTLKSRKQAIFMLQSILQANDLKEIEAVTTLPCYKEGLQLQVNYNDIWSHYFVVLETLLEVQFKLIVQCLNEYLEPIVKYIPPFWCSILFTQILQHHNNFIIHLGVEFIIRQSISLEHDCNLMMVFFTALNNTYLYTEVDFPVAAFAKYLQTMDLNNVLEIMGKINWQPVPVWTMTHSFSQLIEKTHGDYIQTPLLFNFLKHSLGQTKNMPETTTFIMAILANLEGKARFHLEHLMGLYEAIPSTGVVKHVVEEINYHTFENKFIELNQVSVQTKIVFFQYMIPAVKEQLHFLDGFYEKNKAKIRYYPDYEYLLFNSICAGKTLYSALLVLKPRLYNLMKMSGAVTATVESLHLVVSLLLFVVDKYLRGDNKNIAAYESIKKVAYNFYDAFREKAFSGNDPKKIEDIHAKLITLDSILSACGTLYPNSMEVLGILHDAALIENHSINLDRFNPDDDSDNRSIQGFYDCFMKERDQLKASHQANVVQKILQEFPRLNIDIWAAYQILLAGKADINCLFKLVHESCESRMDEVLADALIYGNELKGEEKQEYDFIAARSSESTYNQKIRLSAMNEIDRNKSRAQIKHLKDLLLAKNTEIYRIRYYTNSQHHSMKLRLTQAIGFLYRLDPEWDDRILNLTLTEANQSNVTHINELIIASIVDPIQLLKIVEAIDGNKGLQSMFMIIYYVCKKNAVNRDYIKQSIEFLIKYIFSKQIVVRTAAQIVVIKLCEEFDLISSFDSLYTSIKMTHKSTTSKALKFSYAYEYRFHQIDSQNMLHSMYILREIPRITKMNAHILMSDEYYKNDMFDSENSEMVISLGVNEYANLPDDEDVDINYVENNDETIVHTQHGNVQKKVVAYRETIMDRRILSSLPEDFLDRNMRSDSDLIIVASLLSKATNLGGLARSSEVFGTKAVALENLKVIKNSEFSSVSMASEKWLKFIEVKQYNLIDYLIALKSEGYVLVGAEQTAYGVQLQKANLPKKMVLIMGHEKDGIGAKILNLLDMAVEIPQLGVVRSLNVHVTASIFMWEYCKQHLIEDEFNVSR